MRKSACLTRSLEIISKRSITTIIALLCLFLAELRAQEDIKAEVIIDSVKSAYKNGNEDKANALLFSSIDNFISIKDFKSAGDCYLNYAIILSNKKRIEEALNLTDSALHCFELAHDSASFGKCFFNKGLYNASVGDKITATNLYTKALIIFEKEKDTLNTAVCLHAMGNAFKDLSEYEKSVNYLLRSIDIYRNTNQKRNLSATIDALASVQRIQGEFKESLKSYSEALRIKKELKNDKLIASTLNNIGHTYRSMQMFDSALIYFDQAMAIKRDLGNEKSLSITLLNIGEVQFIQGNWDEAEENYLKAYQYKTEAEDNHGLALLCNNLAELYLHTADYPKATQYLEQGIGLAKKTGNREAELQNYNLQASIYKATGAQEQAVLAYEQYIALKDTLFNEDKNKVLTQMLVEFETKEKEQQITLLKATQRFNEQKAEQAQRVAILTGAILLLVASLAAVFYNRSQIRRKALAVERTQNRQIQSQNEKISLLFKELHHRVNNNLQLLSSMLSLQSRQLEDQGAKDLANEVRSRLKAMSLIHTKMYTSASQLTQLYMPDYIRELSGNLMTAFGYSQDTLDVKIEVEDIDLDTDHAIPIGLILNELICNAFKYAFTDIQQKPALHIALKRGEGSQLELLISDNGKGLSQDKQVWRKGSFGLKLVEILSQQLEGKVAVDSTNGTTYRISLTGPSSDTTL